MNVYFVKDEQKIEDVVQTADNETSEDSDASNLHPVVVKPSQVCPVCEYVVQKKTLKQKIRTVNTEWLGIYRMVLKTPFREY